MTVKDGTYEITFRLYPQEEDGTAVFEEIAEIAIVGGIYSHKLTSLSIWLTSRFFSTSKSISTSTSNHDVDHETLSTSRFEVEIEVDVEVKKCQLLFRFG